MRVRLPSFRILCGYGGIGRHSGLKILWTNVRVGSNPTTRTVAVAELVMHWIVVPAYAGSNPVGHLI